MTRTPQKPDYPITMTQMLTIRFVGMLLNWIFTLYLTQEYLALFGQYSYCLALIAITTTFGACGLPSFLMSKVAKIGRISLTHVIKTIISIFISSILVWILVPYFIIEPDLAIIVSILVCTHILKLIFQEFLVGTNNYIYNNVIEYILRPTSLIISIIYLSLINALFLNNILLVQIAFNVFSLIYLGSKLLPNITVRTYGSKFGLILTPAFKKGLPFLIAVAGQQFIQHTDIIMLGKYVSNEHLGVFKLCIMISALLYVPVQILQQMKTVKLSRAVNDELRTVMNELRITALLIVGPVAIIIFLFADTTAPIILNQQSGISLVPLYILVVMQLLNILVGPVALVAILKNKTGILQKSTGFGALLNVGLNLILIPKFGLSGAALASLIAMTFSNLYLYNKLRV